MNGIINVYKPCGITSHDVIYKVRRILGIKRIGHTGTLDPMATGVLPICVGKATRASELIMASEKEYKATVTFGFETTTQDSTGEPTNKSDRRISKEEFIDVLRKFKGDITQIPPMYSAVHHNGKRLYKLAREGIEVERKPRNIKIFDITLLSFSQDEAQILIKCSKGTYIRTLCEDIGRMGGICAHMSALERVRSGIFTVENSVKVEDISPEKLIPVDEMFTSYKKIQVSGENEKKVLNGAPFEGECNLGEKYRIYSSDNTFLCLSEGIEENGKKMFKMFKSFY